MKKRHLILIATIMVVTLVASILLVSCAKEEQETPPPVETPKKTANDVRAEISNAIKKSFDIDGAMALGFEYGMQFKAQDSRYNLLLKGALDGKNMTGNKLAVSLEKDGTIVVDLRADDEYMYIIGATNRRIKGLKLGEMMTGAVLPNANDLGFFISLPSLIMDLIYTSDEFVSEKRGEDTYNVINGNLSLIGGMLASFVEENNESLAESIENAFAAIKTSLKVTIDKDGRVKSTVLGFDNAGNTSDVTFTSRLENGYEPAIELPSKTDATYVETNLVNFEINGKVDMNKVGSYVENNITTYYYTLSADLDIFEMLRNAVSVVDGSVVLDASKLFDLDDGSIYFNLSHYDSTDEKIEQGNGSILTFAFDPAHFGSKDFFVSAQPLAILPKGFFESLGLPSMIEGFLAGQMGTNINPEALFANIGEAQSTNSETTAGIDTSINAVAIIGKVLDIISSIRITETEGLRLGVDAITDLLYELAPIMNTGNVNVANVVKSFFGDANYMYIDVTSAEYGIPRIENINYYEKFMQVDASVGGYKFDSKRPGPAISIEPIRDINGNIVILSDKVTNYEKVTGDNGEMIYKPLPMSASEYTLMMSGRMSMSYKYTLVTGVTGEASTFVNSIAGFDPNKIGSQKVQVITSLTDGGKDGSVGSLITMLIGLLGLDININANTFASEIVVAEQPTISLYQEGEGAFDASKVYSYGDKLYPKFNVKLTYGDTVKIMKDVAPISGMDKFVNGGNKKNSKIDAVAPFDLDFGVFGKVTVNVDSSTYIAPNAEKITISQDKEYIFPKSISFGIGGASKSVKLTASNVTFVTPDGVEVRKIMKAGFLGQTFDGYAVTFANIGEYEIVANVANGVSQTFTFNVCEKEAVLPSFGADIKGKSGAFTLDITKKNHLETVDKVSVSLDVTGYDTDGSASKLAFGTDYTVKVDGKSLDSNNFVLSSFQGIPTRIEIVVTNSVYAGNNISVSFLATDYESVSVGGAEILPANE